MLLNVSHEFFMHPIQHSGEISVVYVLLIGPTYYDDLPRI